MRILHHAHLYTLDKSKPLASAIAIDHGEIVAVGGEELLSRFAGAPKQDMGGRVILPGLTDAHLHLQHYALALEKIDCETGTLEECLRRVEARVRKAKPGQWILGHGWNQNLWGGWPSSAELDRIAPDHPVYLTAKSLHAAWANSAAMGLANVNETTPDPKDGQIQRGAQGRPSGIFFENAMQLIDRVVPAPSVAGLAGAIERAQPILWKMGLTGVHDFDRRDCFLALQQLHEGGKLKLRVTKNIPVDLLDQAIELGLRTGFGDDWIRIGSVKVFMDGALGPRTAAMFDPYLSEGQNRGVLNLDGEELFELGCRAAEAGLGLTVHAIGDRANHEVLNAYEQLRAYEKKKGLPALRHRIEHVQLLHPDDAGRLAELNVIASMQPIHATSDMLMAERYWGERCALAYAWRTQLAAGTHLAFGSDAPVESPNPFWGIHAAVTRRRGDGSPQPDGWHPEQRLSMQEALEGFTTGAAYAAYAENRMGKLAQGHLADLIVLAEDPFACDPQEVKDFQSSATMVGGDWVWQS
ncbi:MAG TPA: amidohydrolase [Anaerolineales bacterium]|nr:amidohydrolase [Anaerolineales bacterium]